MNITGESLKFDPTPGKVLLIGGCGYVGSAIFEEIKDKYIVDTVDLEWYGNFNNPKNLKEDFGYLHEYVLQQYETVIIVAANSSVPMCKNIMSTLDNNIVKFLNVVGEMKRPGQRLIYASSSCVYVESSDKPMSEDQPLVPNDGLTLSKTILDYTLPLLDVEYYGLRFGSVNGWAPNMRTDLMINSMTLSAMKDKQVNVFNAKAHRPIVSTHDLARSVLAILDSKEDKRGIYNVASFNMNIGDVGQRVADCMGVPLVDKGTSQTYDFMVSSEKFKKTFNFEFTGTVESIVDSIVTKPINKLWTKREKNFL